MCLQPVLGGGILHAVCPRPDKPETKTRVKAKAIKEASDQVEETDKQSKTKRKRETSAKGSDAESSKKHKTETKQKKDDDDKPVAEKIDSYAEVERIHTVTANDRILFYSKSAKCPPGMGPKNKTELVANPKLYNTLFFSMRCPDWRQRLSNFYVAPFTFRNTMTFNTLEHAWHYFKIAEADTSKAYAFIKESGSKLSKGGGLDARNQRKMIVLTQAQLDKWHKKWFKGSPELSMMDSLCNDWACYECWYAKNEPSQDLCKICLTKRDKGRETEPLFQTVLRAKFEQNSECRAVLLETLSAQLWHTPGREPAVRWTWLENVREEMRKTSDSSTTAKPEGKDGPESEKKKPKSKETSKYIDIDIPKFFKCPAIKKDGYPCDFMVGAEGCFCHEHRTLGCIVKGCKGKDA